MTAFRKIITLKMLYLRYGIKKFKSNNFAYIWNFDFDQSETVVNPGGAVSNFDSVNQFGSD